MRRDGKSTPRRPVVCKNCGHYERVGRPRGLCTACYSNLDIRFRYPRVKEGSGRVGEGLREPKGDRRMFVPTKYPPGSTGKLMVMQKRVEMSLPVFHPDDATSWSTEAHSSGPLSVLDEPPEKVTGRGAYQKRVAGHRRVGVV